MNLNHVLKVNKLYVFVFTSRLLMNKKRTENSKMIVTFYIPNKQSFYEFSYTKNILKVNPITYRDIVKTSVPGLSFTS